VIVALLRTLGAVAPDRDADQGDAGVHPAGHRGARPRTTSGSPLLAAHRDRIVARLTELQSDLAVLETKTEHYRYLIEQGLDCDTP